MRRFVPKFHGGPELKIPVAERSARKRGLKSTVTTVPTNVRVIVRNGQIVAPAKFRKVLPQILAAQAKLNSGLSPKQKKGSLVGVSLPLGREGAPAPTTDPQSDWQDLLGRERDN